MCVYIDLYSWFSPLDLKNVVCYLRDKSDMKIRNGALSGKRAEYFKGSLYCCCCCYYH